MVEDAPDYRVLSNWLPQIASVSVVSSLLS